MLNDELKTGKLHELVLQVSAEKIKGHACRIFHFLVN
jgi:hypothetical protein